MSLNIDRRLLTSTLGVLAATLAVATGFPGSAYAQRDNHDNRNNHEERHDNGQHNGEWKHEEKNRDNNRHDWRDNDRDNRDRDNRRSGNDNRPWQGNRIQQETQHRQDTKNQWRNIALASGGVGILGLIQHNPTITFAGAAGALYSANRYEQDRKSQSSDARARAAFFSRPYFERDGHRYERHEVTRNGERYYQFVRR